MSLSASYLHALLQEIKRALLVYAKLNPGIKYIQGMNEIYAPIYYHFATDTDKNAAENAEADAFFCFVELISEFRDNFCQRLVCQRHIVLHVAAAPCIGARASRPE